MVSDLNRAGLVRLSAGGNRLDISAEGVNYGYGVPKLTEIMAGDGRMAGFAGDGRPPFIECSLIDHRKMDVEAMLSAQDLTVTVVLFNGKTLVLSQASNTSENTATSSDGKIAVRWVGTSLKEIQS